MTNGWRSRISPTCHGYCWRWNGHLFTHHIGSLVEWFATRNSVQLRVAVRDLFTQQERYEKWKCNSVLSNAESRWRCVVKFTFPCLYISVPNLISQDNFWICIYTLFVLRKHAWKALYFIMRILKKGNNNKKHLVYTALVRAILEYRAVCWSPYREGQMSALNRVQKRATEFANNRNESGWETLVQRRLITRICVLFKA